MKKTSSSTTSQNAVEHALEQLQLSLSMMQKIVDRLQRSVSQTTTQERTTLQAISNNSDQKAEPSVVSTQRKVELEELSNTSSRNQFRRRKQDKSGGILNKHESPKVLH